LIREIDICIRGTIKFVVDICCFITSFVAVPIVVKCAYLLVIQTVVSSFCAYFVEALTSRAVTIIFARGQSVVAQAGQPACPADVRAYFIPPVNEVFVRRLILMIPSVELFRRTLALESLDRRTGVLTIIAFKKRMIFAAGVTADMYAILLRCFRNRVIQRLAPLEGEK
jgi:hypothetical protein